MNLSYLSVHSLLGLLYSHYKIFDKNKLNFYQADSIMVTYELKSSLVVLHIYLKGTINFNYNFHQTIFRTVKKCFALYNQ